MTLTWESMTKKNYTIEVVFSTSVYAKVQAFDEYEAMGLAEDQASKEFEKLLNDGLLGTSDFRYIARTP